MTESTVFQKSLKKKKELSSYASSHSKAKPKGVMKQAIMRAQTEIKVQIYFSVEPG